MTKDWEIASTVVIAVATPPAMAAWFMAATATSGPLRSLIWDFAFWGWPNWIGSIITVAFTALWFGLPLGGVVWLLLKIWKSKAPKSSSRITGDSDADLYDEK